jgi:hypothetical protein
MPTKRFKIEKVPLTYHPTDHQPVFPPFPVLYLELLENKEKVYPNLKDKAHDPVFIPQTHPYVPIDDNKEFFSNPNPEKNVRDKLNDRLKNAGPVKPYEDDRKSARDRLVEQERDMARSRELSAARKAEQQQQNYQQQQQNYQQQQQNYQQQQQNYQQPATLFEPSAPYVPQASYEAPVPAQIDNTEQSIRNVLGGEQAPQPQYQQPQYQQPQYQQQQYQQQQPQSNLPPSLSEINSQAQGPVKNMAYTNTEDETKRKRELLFRFDILKKSYKEATIPEFTEYTDLVTMERVYEDTVRKVGLDAKVEGYKKFLTMGFFGVEFLFTNFLKVDMSGFAKQQMSTMGTYERLLIELGEKAMIEKSKSQWPVEVRLLFTIVMNAVIFLLMKNVMSGGMNNMMGSLVGAATSAVSGGGDGGGMMSGIMNMMSGLGGGGGGGMGMGGGSTSAPAKPKQKMKGPSINLDDMDKKQV